LDDKSKKLKDLLIVLFRNDMLHPVGGDTLTNEAHIFMRDWRDSRQYGDMYKEWSSLLEQELNIKRDFAKLYPRTTFTYRNISMRR
jgi:hypothetical protein